MEGKTCPLVRSTRSRDGAGSGDDHGDDESSGGDDDDDIGIDDDIDKDDDDDDNGDANDEADAQRACQVHLNRRCRKDAPKAAWPRDCKVLAWSKSSKATSKGQPIEPGVTKVPIAGQITVYCGSRFRSSRT